MRKTIVTGKVLDELLFSIAFFLPAILKPLTVVTSHSTLLLSFTYFALFVVVIVRNNYKLSLVGKKNILLIILIICVLFVFDIIFRKNSMTMSLFSDFFRCGIIPFLFLLNIKDYNKLLFTWAVIAVFVGLMYCTEPLNGYHLTGNYMQFGYGQMLPAFLGTLILTCFFMKKWMIILLILFFVELCVFANKGAIIAAIISVFVIKIISKRKANLKVYFIMAIVVLFTVMYSSNILEFFYKIAKKLNFNSYSLNTISMMIYGDSSSIFNLRLDIWNDSINILKGHWIEGTGIGYYMSIRQTYPHNVFLDILVHSGVICTIIFCILFVNSLFRIKKICNIDKRNFVICMLLLWLIPMNMSLTLWQYSPFWIYFWIVYSDNEYQVNTEI